MASKTLSVFIRLFMVFTLITTFMLFILDFASPEFYILVISTIVGVICIVVGVLMMKKNNKEK